MTKVAQPARRRQTPLLQGCALALALAATGQAPRAHGNAFQGTPTVISGSATIIQGGSSDTIGVSTSEVVINWQPADTSGTGTIDFLPTGSTATFFDAAAAVPLGNYTVLNRILPVNGAGTPTLVPVAFNGTIQSQLAGKTGGAVWFYSPGGIIAGATSIFNVGSLLLTSDAIDTTGGLFGAAGQIRFIGAASPTSTVTIQPGATINANNANGSYVALVAPRVEQLGTVNVDGAVAYVAAEAVDITINGGLFDIAVGTGTGDANGVVHTGTTNVTPDTGGPQRVYLAAVPKNTALTMLLSGTVGYTSAASAAVQDSAVVLSAGHDIFSGAPLSTPNATTGAAANISIGNGSYDPAAFTAQASGAITASPTGFGTINFNGATILGAGSAVMLGADNGETINAAGDLSIRAGLNGAGGTATVYADGIPFSTPPVGQVNVTGVLTVDSSAIGLDNFAPGAPGGNALGGISEIRSGGGTVSAGSISLLSTATRGFGDAGSGSATGGTARLTINSVSGAGSIGAASLFVDVSAYEPFASNLTPINGGAGMGGSVAISADGGSFDFGNLSISANAIGGTAAAGGTAGAATGGSVGITLGATASGAAQMNLTNCAFGCFINADATGGDGPDGAAGTGGGVTLTAAGGALVSDSNFFISASGFGGATAPGGITGKGTGGSVLLQLLSSSGGGSAMNFGDLDIRADGNGEPIPGDFFSYGNGGDGMGGSAVITLAAGTLTANSLMIGASGLGGQAGDSAGPTLFSAGRGLGGQSTFTLSGGTANIATDLSILATGTGGYAQSPGFPGNLMGTAGDGTGGAARLVASGGALNAANIFVHAYGAGGANEAVFDANASPSGNGLGGTANVIVTGSVALTTNMLEVAANGDGGAGSFVFSGGTANAGAGGSGTGGTASLSLNGGNLTGVIPSLLLSARGGGGAGGDNQGTDAAGAGGNGTGGSALLDGTNAAYSFTAVTLDASGAGGSGGTDAGGGTGATGSGTGGFTRLTNSGTAAPVGSRAISTLTLNVGGTGSSVLSGRMELADTSTFSGGGLVISGDLAALNAQPAANANSGFYYTGAGNGLAIGGNAMIDTGGNAEFTVNGTGTLAVAGNFQVTSAQSIIVRHGGQPATPVPSISAANATFASAGDFTGQTGSLIRTANALAINSTTGSISTDRLNSGGTTQLTALNGAVNVASDLLSAGTVQASGRAVAIRSSGALAFTNATASAGDLTIIAGNGLSLPTGTASGTVTLGATLGDISVGDLSGGAISIGTFGTAGFIGLSQAQTIAVSSGDIVIGAGAQIGVAGTTSTLTLANARTVNPTYVGGAGVAGGYSLSAAELARLFSDSIAINGSFGGAAGPDVVIDSFTMASRAGTPTGNLAANGSLSISSAGSIQVIGNVALTGLGAGNQLFLTAQGATGTPGAIEVDATRASIRLTDATGALAGRINFDANDVFVATPAAIADVRAAGSTDAVSARLALNDGVTRGGIISAGTIFANVGGGLYIQNLGVTDARADRRGFAALTDTLDIATKAASTRIIVNGQLFAPVGGAALSGENVIPLVRINGVVGPRSGSFDPRSTVNGCLIASPVLCSVLPEQVGPPPHSLVEQPLDPDGSSGNPLNLFPTSTVELKGIEPLGYPPLIDEPVTGAGNDDLWMPPCHDDEDQGCGPQ